MTDQLVESSSPVFEIDGTVNVDLGRDLEQLEIEETTAGLRTLQARFVGHGPGANPSEETQLYLDGTVLDFGKKVKVAIGPLSDQRTIFDGLLSGLEACFRDGAPPAVGIFAEDRLMRLRMTRHMKTYEKMSDADIAQAIASGHGMQVETDADGPTYDVVQQWNLSDLAFLRERARLIQAEIWFESDKLHFVSRNRRTGTELTLVQGDQLIDVEARADLAHQRTTVQVSGYDASARDAIDAPAESNTIDAEISSGRTGPAVLEQAFGERVSFRVREVPLADGEARSYAGAEMLRRARAFVTVTGTTRGSPDMVVGSRLTLQRVGHPFDGAGYYVTRVCHTFDLSRGHRTKFAAERPTLQEGA